MHSHPDTRQPGFLSISFHVGFFSALLWRIMFRKKEGYHSPFENHVPLEFTVLTILSIAIAFYGFQSAASNNSISGWIFGIIGLGVFIALLINSIASASGGRPSWESFSVKVFLFFVFFGLTAGLMAGRIGFTQSGFMLVLFGLAGLLPGYLAGILAGYWIHRLGWISPLFEMAALVAIPGMIVLDVLMQF